MSPQQHHLTTIYPIVSSSKAIIIHYLTLSGPLTHLQRPPSLNHLPHRPLHNIFHNIPCSAAHCHDSCTNVFSDRDLFNRRKRRETRSRPWLSGASVRGKSTSSSLAQNGSARMTSAGESPPASPSAHPQLTCHSLREGSRGQCTQDWAVSIRSAKCLGFCAPHTGCISRKRIAAPTCHKLEPWYFGETWIVLRL